MTHFSPRPRQTEVTPGNIFQLGLPFVLGNQSLFNYWDIRSGNYFIEMEGEFYGWDNATIQLAGLVVPGAFHGPVPDAPGGPMAASRSLAIQLGAGAGPHIRQGCALAAAIQ